MSDQSAIEWTDATWNPTRGCDKISPGCKNCYASTFAERWRGIPGHPYEQGFDLRLVPEKLDEPLKWKKPRKIFVNSMSDLFHKDVPDEFIARVFATMRDAAHHTFQILTKRPDRMQRWAANYCADPSAEEPRPLPNVWLGVSVENQAAADERIPLLRETPAAVRFLSVEPLLGPVDLSRFMWPTHWHWDARFKTPEEAKAAGAFAERKPQALLAAGVPLVDWIIVGGESGPGARPCSVRWIRDVVAQCKTAGVPCFVKQLGARPMAMRRNADLFETVGFIDVDVTETGTEWIKLKSKKGGDPAEWPADLRVREFPRGAA